MMINLLPPQEKKELAQKKKYRLILILGTLTLSFFLVLSLVLLLVETHLSIEVENQNIMVKAEEEHFKHSKIENLEKEIQAVNENLIKLDSFYQIQLGFTALMEKISGSLPSRLYLTRLLITPLPKKENKFQVSLHGFSPTRESLSQLKKELESNFQEVEVPPTNWIKPKDIQFKADFQFEL